MNKQMLTEAELAERWGISKRTLQTRRKNGDCPLYVKISGHPRYELADVIAFEEQKMATLKKEAAAEIAAAKKKAAKKR